MPYEIFGNFWNPSGLSHILACQRLKFTPMISQIRVSSQQLLRCYWYMLLGRQFGSLPVILSRLQA